VFLIALVLVPLVAIGVLAKNGLEQRGSFLLGWVLPATGGVLVGALAFSWLKGRRASRRIDVVGGYAIAAGALIGMFVKGGPLDSLIAGAVLGFFVCLSGALALMRRRKAAPAPH
jgi:hypothetical protein